MQPTYLAWLGYYGMIYRSEKFVFLDNVQFNKRSWQQRNRIKSPENKELLLTVPVKSKGLRDQLISEVEIDRTSDYINKHINEITRCYKKAKYFDAYANDFFEILKRDYCKNADLCIDIIKLICDKFKIATPTLRASSLAADGSKAERLANICQELGANQYLSAIGSKEYISESDSFTKRNIEVIYNEYNHPIYNQMYGEFISQLSILDLLFNEGPNSLNIILSGYEGKL